jgi:predicted SnoaL-like aldol condensation-catalyzing enzyme
MSAEDNKRLVRRFYEEIDKGNLDTMDELVAENYVDHNPPPFPGLAEGREGLKQSFKIFWKATPGHHERSRPIFLHGPLPIARPLFGCCCEFFWAVVLKPQEDNKNRD